MTRADRAERRREALRREADWLLRVAKDATRYHQPQGEHTMTDPTNDRPTTTEARIVTMFRPGSALADLAAAICELDASCREQRDTIERLTGERDRARDLAARLEADIAELVGRE